MLIDATKKTVGVIGLGPVGLTWSSYLIKQGWQVLAFDNNPQRVENLKNGQLPFEEEGIQDILFTRSRPHSAFQINPNVAQVETWFVCTGLMGSEDMGNVFSAIDFAAQHKAKTIFLRTTLPMPALSSLQEKAGELDKKSIRLAYFPEFMREGMALHDMESHDVFLGHNGDCSVSELLGEMLPDKVIHSLGIGEAMLLKLSCNAFHALKVAFINEVADVAHAHKIDCMEVSKAFKQDRRLNISPAYLTPGSPFGGSCLDKDLAFLTDRGQKGPLLSSIQTSNEAHKNRIFNDILQIPAQSYLLLGDSFKPGTSDTRKSIPLELSSLLKNHDKTIAIAHSTDDIEAELKNSYDVIILGPLPPTPSILELLSRSTAVKFDLQYHADYKLALSSDSKYQSIFI